MARSSTSGYLWAAGAVLGSAAAVGAYAAFVEPRWLEVTYPQIRLPRLPAAWSGLRIAQLTDLHFGQYSHLPHVAHAIDETVAAQPDLILVTGDFVSRRHVWSDEVMGMLRRLQAPLGVYGCLGNHDHSAGGATVAEHVEAAGIRMLRNTNLCLERDGEPLYLLGMDCYSGKQYHLSEPLLRLVDERYTRFLDGACAGVPEDAFRLLLAHTPDVIMEARKRGIDLVLSGHTHGGQVRLPVVGATIVPSRYGAKYAAGLFHEGPTTLYVCRGIGMVRLPVRFLCRPELAILTLRRGE